ncbi:hypothetical protein BDR06DRAFT_977221 [Suillus hirtellus]|nr:hypothetical protein BDR06DRAFT_977221 [Suillus hirtellus]
MYIPGTGHTEGEGCKHIFLSSNKLAHRHQQVCNSYCHLSKSNSAYTMLKFLMSLLNNTNWDVAQEVSNTTLTSIPTSSLQEVNNALALAHIHVDSFYVKLQHVEELVTHIETQLAVDQWLFELSKLSLSGTGYKLCQQLGKALQHRLDAIHNAINCYNTQATALNPPCSKISWKNITDYGFIAEFNIL